jgi:hypothetical protein
MVDFSRVGIQNRTITEQELLLRRGHLHKKRSVSLLERATARATEVEKNESMES